MAERNVGRPWTEQEDKFLKEAVAKHGEQDNWKNIALCVPGRSNKACRKRWLHSLSPHVKKTAWTAEEDRILLESYGQHGAKWSTIARSIPGRTDDACSKRYREALDPNLKKDEWTPEEDEKLTEVFSRIGGRWGQIGQEMQRSGLGCRNRWRLLERKKAAALKATTQLTSSHAVSPPQEQSQSLPSPAPSHPTLSPAQCPPLPPEEISLAETQPAEPVQPHHDPAPLDIWAPYYPPEAYHIPGGSFSPSHSFRVPTPEMVSVSPYIAPFQFSSSSLSAALSAPPQPPRPLPPVPSEIPLMETQPGPELLPSTTIATNASHSNDNLMMSLDDPSITVTPEPVNESHQVQTALQLPPVFTSPLLQPPINFNVQHPSMSTSPISHTSDISIQADHFTNDIWKSPNPFADFYNVVPILDQSPHSNTDTQLLGDGIFEDLSSASSTPFFFRSSLSPTSSPNVSSPVDLPGNEQSTVSLLFSTPREPPRPYAAAPSNRRRPTTKKLLKPLAQTRLSSSLPLTADPSIKPYACGTEACWPVGVATSSACFATSKELFDHNKNEHGEDNYTEKPFRCALAGCGKSWKSINGLQYHLQISTAHFRTALSTRFSSQSLNEDQNSANSNTDPEAEDNEREYVCQVPDCFKAYKHSSGLRYHMKHGHPQNLPVQLSEVPPALARQLTTKTRRMRRKALSEEL